MFEMADPVDVKDRAPVYGQVRTVRRQIQAGHDTAVALGIDLEAGATRLRQARTPPFT